MAHFLLTTHWTRGDVLPFLFIGKRLKERGHEVTLFSHGVFRSEAEANGLRFVPWETEEEWKRDPFLSSWTVGPTLNSYFDCEKIFTTYFTAEKYKSELEKILPFARRERTVFIIRYSSSVSAMTAAELCGAPVLPVFITPSYLNQVDIDHDVLGNICTDSANRFRDALGLPRIIDWSTWSCNPPVHIGLWPDWFFCKSNERIKELVHAGFPNYHDYVNTDQVLPAEVERFLEAGDSPLVISGSSGKDKTITYFAAAIEACRELGYRALLVTPHRELVPDNLPAMMKWIPFSNFEILLPRTRAILHHGGIGTLCCAVRAGIPQVLLANNIDRPFNALQVERLGMGKFLPVSHWNKRKIKDALAAVFTDAVHVNCARYAGMIQEERAIDRVCDLAERAVDNRRFKLTPEAYIAEEHSPKHALSHRAPHAARDVAAGLSAGKKEQLRKLLLDKAARRQGSES